MKICALLGILLSFSVSYSQSWKELLNDNSVNFYTVCNEVENYFLTHDKNVKGSGWKTYQRWRAQNEYKYYPSGDRSNIDPYFVQHAYQNFLANSPNSKALHPNGWKELGPFTIDSTTGGYAVGLGRIEDFHVDPINSDIVYLASRSGGVWKTTDGGANWSTGLTDFLVASGCNIFSVSSSNPDSVLINVRNSDNGTTHGVYRSIDGGDSWAETPFNPTTLSLGGLGSNFQVFQVKYHPRVPDLVFIGTSNGVYRSTDNLQTWDQEWKIEY